MFNWIMDGGLLESSRFAPGWTQLNQASTIAGRFGHQMAVVNNKLFTYGGQTGSSAIRNEFWRHDLDLETWSSLTTVASRAYYSLGVVENQIYLFGGTIGTSVNTSTNYHHAYDINLGTWQSISTSPRARYAHSCTVAGDKIYIHGGMDANGNGLSDIHMFNTVSRLWSQLTSGGYPGAFNQMTHHDNNLYQLDRNGTLRTYDLSQNRWTQEPATPLGLRVATAMVTIGDDIYVHGGSGKDDLWKYNVLTKAWTEINLSIKPSARYNHAFCEWNGLLLIHGGRNGSTQYNDLWVFNPQGL